MPSNHYVLYARRSTDSEDKQVLSLESQVDEMRKVAEIRGIEIDEVVKESGSARVPKTRPLFAEMMKKIESGKVTGVLAWKVDRLARNMMDGGELIYLLSEGILKEIVTPEGTYTGSGDSKFMLAMLFGAAAKMTDDLSLAVRRGNRAVLKKGQVPGPVPLGYTKTHEFEAEPGSGRVIPDPERFDLVRAIWRDMLAGKTPMEAWQRARDGGLCSRPTAKSLARPVSLASVYGILGTRFYTGTIRWGDEEWQGEHAPMVTPAEYEKVQERIGRRVPVLVKPPHGPYLFKDLLHCGHCGRHLVGERHEKPTGLTFTYYRCTRRGAGEYQCHAPAPSEREVTEAVAAVLERVTVDPQYRRWAKDAIEWWAGKEEGSVHSRVRKATKELARAEHELAHLLDLYLQQLITKEDLIVRRANLTKKIDHLRDALARPAQELEEWRAAKGELTHLGEYIAREFANGDPTRKHSILERTVEDIVVTNRRCEVKLRFPYRLVPTDLHEEPCVYPAAHPPFGDDGGASPPQERGQSL